MKAKVIFCDICMKRILYNDGDIRIKYKTKERWDSWYESGWTRIDICANCLDKIIKAKEESENE